MKKIIAVAIALLGFATACDKDDDITPMYGVESVEYHPKNAVMEEVVASTPEAITDENE